MKNSDFLHSAYQKLLSQVEGNAKHNLDFFKKRGVHNFRYGRSLRLLTPGAEDLATPLISGVFTGRRAMNAKTQPRPG